MVVVSTVPSDETEISDLFAVWFRAMELGDIDGCLELVTDDVVSKPPTGPSTYGRDALRRRLQAFHGHAAEQVDHEVIEVQVSGDLAYAWVAERANVQPFDGSAVSFATTSKIAGHRKLRWLMSSTSYAELTASAGDKHDEAESNVDEFFSA